MTRIPRSKLAIGTQVVIQRDVPVPEEGAGGGTVKKAGTVAVIVELPAAAEELYAVRCADQTVLHVHRDQLTVRRALSPDLEAPPRPIEEFEPHLILCAVLGSRAFGLSDEHSDTDDRGIFLPPAEWHWSLRPVPEQVEFSRSAEGVVSIDRHESAGDDHCWWELEKFLRLSLRANPTALEFLFVPETQITAQNEWGRELRSLRRRVLSKHLYQTFSGYALSQFRRMQRALEGGREPKAKHAMHLVRLLISGIGAVRTGDLDIDVSAHREELLAIKRREIPFEAVHERALALAVEFEAEYSKTELPDHPDVETIDQFLIRARRSAQ